MNTSKSTSDKLINAELLYVHDPMCSWCWGFAKIYQKLIDSLPPGLSVKRLVGGLAPDSDEPMPESTRQMVQQNWQRIQQKIPGTEFNYDFWNECEPRRSTYPACRAVLSAREQGAEFDAPMTKAIQQAYYCDAKNPSDDDVLTFCASSIGIDVNRFVQDYTSGSINDLLAQEISYCRSIGADSFPSLVVKSAQSLTPIAINYNDADAILSEISRALALS